MKEATPHPSFLALDRLALGATVEPELEAHVATCRQCRQHIEGLRQGPPHARRAITEHSRPMRARAAPIRTWAVGTAIAAAAAAWMVWTPASPPGEEPAFTTRRGAASVAVYVKRAGQVWLWDGQRSIAPGDRIRLSVAPEGFSHVAVFTRASADAPWTQLYAASLSSRETEPGLLPTAWEVDASAGPEWLRVVLAHDPVDAAAAAARADSEAADGLWIRSFEIPKETQTRTPAANEAP